MKAEVLLYTAAWCPYCRAAKDLLKKKNATFTEIDVDGRDDLRQWLRGSTGQHTVPQVFINGTSVGGFSDIDQLNRQGKLDSLLAVPPPVGVPPLPR